MPGIYLESYRKLIQDKMSKCRFSMEFSQTPEELAGEARRSVMAAGGSFDGGDSEGTFSLSTGLGRVKGSYTILGKIIHVDISDKPLLVACGRIKDELSKYLEN